MIKASIFKAYDIRGIVDQTLTEDAVRQIGPVLGTKAHEAGRTSFCVGLDGRLSGERLANALMEGIVSAGVDVIDIGMVPTPVLYFATAHFGNGTGVAVTGSHNPPEYNGLKMMIGGFTLFADQIQNIRTRIEAQDWRVAGPVATKLFKALGCEVTELYTDVDGSFPNHHPDSSKPANLEDLKAAVRTHELEVGLAFDVDRLGVVTKSGSVTFPDRHMMLFAKDILVQHPGAPFAGEMSGHLFLNDGRWPGFDDGIYAGARLLEILSRKKDPSAVLEALPSAISTPST